MKFPAQISTDLLEVKYNISDLIHEVTGPRLREHRRAYDDNWGEAIQFMRCTAT